MLTKLAEGTFEARVIRETSHGLVGDYGVVHNRVVLYAGRTPRQFCVEWTADDDPDVYAEIGVWVDDKRRVVDYDGVFDLPREIRSFLTAQGFDLSELA